MQAAEEEMTDALFPNFPMLFSPVSSLADGPLMDRCGTNTKDQDP